MGMLLFLTGRSEKILFYVASFTLWQYWQNESGYLAEITSGCDSFFSGQDHFCSDRDHFFRG